MKSGSPKNQMMWVVIGWILNNTSKGVISKCQKKSFFREDKLREALSELTDKWGKLFDESAKESKDAFNDLGLFLTYLIMDLKCDPHIEEYYKMSESKVALI